MKRLPSEPIPGWGRVPHPATHGAAAAEHAVDERLVDSSEVRKMTYGLDLGIVGLLVGTRRPNQDL